MGAQHTTLKSSAVINICNQAIVSSISDCVTTASGSQTQIVDLGAGNIGSMTQTMNQTVNNKCIKKAVQSGKLVSSIANKMSQSLKSTTTGTMALMGESIKAKEDTKINETVKNSIDLKTVQQCVTGLSSKQVQEVIMKYGNIGSMRQGDKADEIAVCTMQSKQQAGLVSKLTNSSNQAATVKSEGTLSALGGELEGAIKGVMGSIMGIVGFAMVGVIIIGIAGAYIYFQHKKKEKQKHQHHRHHHRNRYNN